MHILRMNPSVWTHTCRAGSAAFLVHSLHTEFPAVASGAITRTHTALSNIFSHRILSVAESSECVAQNFEENQVRLQEMTQSLCNPPSPGNPEPETCPIPAVALPTH